MPLLNNVIDMSSNIMKQVMKELAAIQFPISIQLDESTDVSHHNQLLVFVRYVNADAIKKHFFFVSPFWKLQRLLTF